MSHYATLVFEDRAGESIDTMALWDRLNEALEDTDIRVRASAHGDRMLGDSAVRHAAEQSELAGRLLRACLTPSPTPATSIDAGSEVAP